MNTTKLNKLFTGLALLAFSGAAISVPVTLSLLTDDFAGETSFSLVGDMGDVAYDSWSSPTDPGFPGLDDGFIDAGDLLSATLYTFTWDLGAGDYNFTINDSFGDGICCEFGVGNYSFAIDGDEILAGGEFGKADGIGFTIEDTGVPEPGTLLLVALGLIGIGASRRRLV